MDIQAQFVKAKDQDANPMKMLQENVVRELEKAYSGLIQGDENLSEALAVINAETGNEFVIIFDEWDYPIRELAEQSRERQDYIEFLRMMFKNADAQDYVRLAYLTGILPMVRAKGQSAVNNFDEYTMIDARDLGGDIGFVEEEVQALCEKSGVSAAEMKYWYDGYDLGGVEVYNPLSVVRAVETTKQHQAHLLVAVLNREANAIEAACFFTDTVNLCSMETKALGIYTTGTVYEPSFYNEWAGKLRNGEMPLPLWVYVGLVRDENGLSGYTYGLTLFGRLELEIIGTSRSHEELYNFLYGVCEGILSEGMYFHDGETLSFTSDQRLTITKSKAVYVEGDSFKIEY